MKDLMFDPATIDASEPTRDRFALTTLPFSHRPCGVVRVGSADEVVALVRWARTTRTALYPIARGKNWGYGDAMAPTPGALIVDLGAMKRIEVDETLAYAVLEPGVSQAELHAHLAAHHPSLWSDANGAGPDASVVGNLLERGFGHTPVGDRASLCAGLEVVLGTGERLATGHGRFPGAHARDTYRHGVGPALDGLFFQSSFGIVTRVAVWLQRRPEAFGAFVCRAADAAQMPALVDAVRELRLAGVVRSCVHVANVLRSLSGAARYPWDLTDGRRPVPAEWIAASARERGLGAWNASGGVYGPPAVVDAALAVLREALAPFHVMALRDHALEALPAELRAAIGPAIGLLRGEPTSFFLRGAAWRSRDDRGTNDPIADGAGLVWVVPTLPATGDHARRVEAIATATLHRYGFDAPLTLTFVNERTLLATTNVSFDKTSAEDRRAAWDCARELTASFIAAGYPPYRAGLGSYDLLVDHGPHAALVGAIRAACDPDGVIAPGRYAETLPPAPRDV